MLDKIMNFYKSVNYHLLTDWIFRITIAALHENHDATYPTVVYGLCIFAVWLYFFRLYLVSVIPMIFAGLLNYMHECY